MKQGKSIMSYLNKIDVQLVEVPVMYLVSIRKWFVNLTWKNNTLAALIQY